MCICAIASTELMGPCGRNTAIRRSLSGTWSVEAAEDACAARMNKKKRKNETRRKIINVASRFRHHLRSTAHISILLKQKITHVTRGRISAASS